MEGVEGVMQKEEEEGRGCEKHLGSDLPFPV